MMRAFIMDQKQVLCYGMGQMVLWMLAIHYIGEALPVHVWPQWGPSMVWLLGFWGVLDAISDLWRIDYQSDALTQWLANTWVARTMIIRRLMLFTLLHFGSRVLVLPLLAVLFDVHDLGLIVLGWVAVLPYLWWVGGSLSALSLGLKNRSSLLILVSLPLYLPGVFLALMWLQGHLTLGQGLPWWVAMAALFCTIAPMSIETALRIGVDQ